MIRQFQMLGQPSYLTVILLLSVLTVVSIPIDVCAGSLASHPANQTNEPATSGSGSTVAPQATNPRSSTWRKVREGVVSYSAVTGPEAGQLIQSGGEVWRRIRNGPLARYGPWAMLATLAALGMFYLVRGQVKLAQQRTGTKLLRWTGLERLIHWYTAMLFVLLAVTGLSILYGRSVLIPILGHEHFAVWASWAKLIHNYAGPLFMAGLFTMIVIWLHDNLPDKQDFAWFKAFGGLIGSKHPSAGRMNAGEKAWFWLLFWCGMLISLTGLILDFPVIEQQRLILQITHIIHLSCAVLLIIGALGHIYIGTIGTEGALEGMITGEVDEAWAKQHHDRWYEEVIEQNTQQQGLEHHSIGRLSNVSQQTIKESDSGSESNMLS